MKRKLLAAILTLMILIYVMPTVSTAEVTPPASLDAPEHFGVGSYYGNSLYFTFSAPEDMRSYIEKRAADDPDNNQIFSAHFQIDYKIDNGSWHYTSDWDLPETDLNNTLYTTLDNRGKFMSSERESMSSLFPDDAELKVFGEAGWDYLKSHSITFRIRFVESFDYAETNICSDWSNEYKLSANMKADTDKLINHAPVLKSAEVKKLGGGEPYFDIKTGIPPAEIKDLNSISSSSVRTEIWMRRAGDKDFKLVEYEWANWESFEIEASDYFDDTLQSYDAESYEIKVRYALDLREYKQAGYFETATTSVDIYSPFSNVISHNMPAWSNASNWATGELKEADEEGLIPDILQGADMTKPITREEFCELAVLLYEKASEKTAVAKSPNPFTDTTNPQILKAAQLGITQGVTLTTFVPKKLITREQCAAMLFRTIQAIDPDGNFSTDGVKDFPDQKDISGYAVPATKYMSKLGIIKGDAKGNFMPKANPSVSDIYGMATREAAILMSLRTFEQLGQEPSGAPSSSSAAASSTEPAPGGEPAANGNAGGILGTWLYSDASGNVGYASMYEFRADGTFTKGLGTVVMYSYSATSFEGKYKISADKVILYDQKKGTGTASSWEELWQISESVIKDIPVDDDEYTFSITAKGTLIINDNEYSRM